LQPVTFASQIVAGVPSTVQVSATGQVVAPQLPSAHVTSHAHDSPQATASQAFAVVHLTSQAPAPQVMLPHALFDEHVMLHPAPSRQLIESHDPVAVHEIVQSYPSGHVTAPHLFALLHVIWQVLSATLQLEHPDGHTGTTQ
jgi:hypothetical protein